MTKTIFQNWKVIAGLSIAVVLLGSVFSFGMFTPKAEAEHTPCPGPTTIQHWDKIIFQILRDPHGVIAEDWLKVPLDIKVLDDPTSVAHLDSKIREFLEGPDVIPTIPPGVTLTADEIHDLKIDIIDVEYAIVTCTVFVTIPD